MNNIDTSAIVATAGTIAALVLIALFLRGIGRGKVKAVNAGAESSPFKRANWQGVKIGDGAASRIKGGSDKGGVTDEEMERLVKASGHSRVMYGNADDPRWSKEALEGGLISHHLINEIDEQCAQRIAEDEMDSQQRNDSGVDK